jgi:hypothetical protein
MRPALTRRYGRPEPGYRAASSSPAARDICTRSPSAAPSSSPRTPAGVVSSSLSRRPHLSRNRVGPVSVPSSRRTPEALRNRSTVPGSGSHESRSPRAIQNSPSAWETFSAFREGRRTGTYPAAVTRRFANRAPAMSPTRNYADWQKFSPQASRARR